MKTFLKVDLGIQISLFLILAIGIFGKAIGHHFGGGIFLYFIFMGAWQPISAALHLILEIERNRAMYLVSAIIYICLLPIVPQWNVAVPLYFFGAFAFSIWYFGISYVHLKRLENASRSFWDLA